MTAFAAQPIIRAPEAANVFEQAGLSPSAERRAKQAYERAREIRAQAADQMVIQQRFARPDLPEQISQRRRDRLTVSEINRLSDEGLERQLRPWDASDDRSPMIRLLDTIDLPRNAIANIAFGSPNLRQFVGGAAATAGTFGAIGAIGGGLPGAAIGSGIGLGVYGVGSILASITRGHVPEHVRREIIGEQRTGALGAPSIFFSDALERAGVENRVTRAVLGFGGDVLMDPLTYISGGGSVITRQAADGMRFTLNSGGAKLLDDLTNEVIRTGRVPTRAEATQRFGEHVGRLSDLFRDTVRIEQIGPVGTRFRVAHDVGGEANRLPRARAAIQDAENALSQARRLGDPGGIARAGNEARRARRALQEAVNQEIFTAARISPQVGPVEAFRGQLSRDFLRRYMAKSDHQLFLPFTGFLANRLRVPLQGWTPNLAIGRFGESARIRRSLGATEDEFRRRVSRETDEVLSALRSERAALVEGRTLKIAGTKVGAQAATRDRARSVMQPTAERQASEILELPIENLEPREIERLMRDGWILDDTRRPLSIDRLQQIDNMVLERDARARTERWLQARQEQFESNRDLTLARARNELAAERIDRGAALADDADIENMRRQLEQLSERAEEAGRMVEELASPVMVRFGEAMSDRLNTLKNADAYTAVHGPMALLKNYTPGWHRANEIRERRAMIQNEADSVKRLTDIQKESRADRLRQLSPDGFQVENAQGQIEQHIRRISPAHEDTINAAQDIRRSIDAGEDGARHTVPIETPSERLNALGNQTTHVHTVRRMETPEEAMAARGTEEVRSVAGEVNRITITFEDQLDRLAYEATKSVREINAVPDARARSIDRARRREARDYLQRVYGVSESSIARIGRFIRESAESAGGAEFVMPRTNSAARRRRWATGGIKVRIDRPADAPPPREQLALLEFAEDAERPIQAARETLRNLERVNRMSEIQHSQLRRFQDQAEEAGALAEEIRHLDSAGESSRRALRESYRTLDDELQAIEQGTLYNSTRTILNARNFFRDVMRVGSPYRILREPIRRWRIQNEEQARLRKREFLRDIDTEITNLQTRLGGEGIQSRDVQDALLHRVIQQQFQNTQQRMPFLPDDPHTMRVRELSQTEEGRSLLNSPEIDSAAQRINREFADWWQIDQSLGIVQDHDFRWAYFPGSMTERAEAAIRSMNREKQAQSAAMSARRLSIEQVYTRPRMTNRVLYGAGNERLIKRIESGAEITGDDLARMAQTDSFVWSGELQSRRGRYNDYEQWRQDFLSRNQHLRRPGDVYDASDGIQGVREGERWHPPEFPSSPMYLNSQRHNFTDKVDLTGGADIFDEDLVSVLSKRFLQHEYARSAAKFRDEVAPLVRPMSNEAAMQFPKHPRRKGDVRMIDGVGYRRLDGRLISESQLRLPLDNDQLGMWYPEALATAVEDFARSFQTPRQAGDFLRGVDWVQTEWKAMTLLHPAWWVVNMVGGSLNSLVAGGSRVADWIRYGPRMMQIAMKYHGVGGKNRGLNALSDSTQFKIGDTWFSEREWAEMGASSAIYGGARAQHEVLNVSRLGADPGKKFTNVMSDERQSGVLGRYLSPWFRFNAATDDVWRGITTASRMNQGDNYAEAVQKSIRAHFDYGDMAYGERQVGLRVWPWLRWMRNNAALQIKMLQEKPAWIASFPKLQNALEEALVDTEQQVPDELRPRWLKDSIGVQLAARPNAKFLITHNLTPIQEVLEIGQSVMGADGFLNAIKWTASSMSPWMTMPAEIVTGRNTFTGRLIGDEDVPIHEHLFGNLRPVREFRQAKQIVYDDIPTRERAVALAMRLALGGRFHRIDDENLLNRRRWEGINSTKQLRSEVRRAWQNDETEEAQEKALELVGRWRQLHELGYTDLVPREMRAYFRRENAELEDRIR